MKDLHKLDIAAQGDELKQGADIESDESWHSESTLVTDGPAEGEDD